jgi:hypothetical protein
VARRAFATTLLKVPEKRFRSGLWANSSGYLNSFLEAIQDLPYANAVRKAVVWGANYGFLMPVIRMANTHAAMKKALYDSVSGKVDGFVKTIYY